MQVWSKISVTNFFQFGFICHTEVCDNIFIIADRGLYFPSVHASCVTHSPIIMIGKLAPMYAMEMPPSLPPALCDFGRKRRYFEKLSYGFETWDMTSDGLGEMFKGDFAHTCADKFPAQRAEHRV